MQIEKISLKNYRQFRDIEIVFNESANFKLHRFLGSNGVGKTTLLNAINWCLYNDEPHLTKESDVLPIVNLNTIKDSKDGDDIIIEVNIQLKSGDNRIINFVRRSIYTCTKNNINPMFKNTVLRVRYIDDEGNSIWKDDEEEVSQAVSRFVPLKLREYFFFDGERLETYFTVQSRDKIKNAVMAISEIEVLRRTENRLDEILKLYRRNSGSLSPDLKKIEEKISKKEIKLKELNKKLEGIETTLSDSINKVEEYNKNLEGLPNVDELNKRYNEYNDARKNIESDINIENSRKNQFLYDLSKILLLRGPVSDYLKIIKDKKNKKEIPVVNDKTLIQDILSDKHCNICNRSLDDNSIIFVQQVLDDIKLSTNIATKLMISESNLSVIDNMINNLNDKIKSQGKILITKHKYLTKTQQMINKIDNELSGHNQEQISKWHRERKTFQDIIIYKSQEKGDIKSHIETTTNELESMNVQYQDELKKVDKKQKYNYLIEFTKKSLNIIKNINKKMIIEVKKQIEKDTKDNFFKLIWKTTTFKDVTIDDDFNVRLIHIDDYSMLGSASRAETELLALAFTIALHNISGFEAPIIIDTPVARVSDINRENFGSSLVKLSEFTQVILLFTPDEFTTNIRKIIDPAAINKYELKLTSDEKEVILNVIS